MSSIPLAPETIAANKKRRTVASMSLAWHAASDHAADGSRYGSPLCNCERIAQRAYDLGWRDEANR